MDMNTPARLNLLRSVERDEIERGIATCECGAQVRRDSSGVWEHIGRCKLDVPLSTNSNSRLN